MGNFYEQLEASFRQAGRGDCLRLAQQSVWRYDQLITRINAIAARLSEYVEPADRVMVQVQKSADNLALYLATLKLGAVYVPLNTAYTAAELDYFVDNAQPALFVGEQTREDVPSLTLDDQGGGSLLRDLPVVETFATTTRQAHDVAAILYTSGTTGRSKGAMLTHENLRSNAQALSQAWGWRKDDVLLHALPIFHVHGLFIASHCALLNGTPMEFLPRFDAQQVMAALPRCTVMMGVPTFYTRLLAQADLAQISMTQMRVFICGSAPLTEPVFEAWYELTGHRILERYGMSETIINTTNPLQGERVAGTVGFALPGLQLRIADDAGQAVGDGEVGTIEVKGANVFSGYWRMPDKTAEEFRDDGFFITGDLGTVDDQGRVSIVGRAKDLVISGGYNVYPKEVERLLDDMPGVQESAVIGVPHHDFGEAVVAVLVPEQAPVSQQQTDAYLSDRLARFKQPKAVVNVDSLPRNTMGKVQKNRLRELYQDLFA